MDTDIIVILVPIAFIIATAFIIWVWGFFHYRTRQSVQQTLRTAIEHGQQLTPELLERLALSAQTKDGDLRRGVLSIGIAVAICGIAFLLGQADAVRPLLAIAVLPLLIGLAYLGLWKLAPRA